MEREIDLLKAAATEIRILRNENKLLSARLDMFDKMMLLLHTAPEYTRQGISLDLIYEIETFIETKQKETNG